MIVDGPLIVVLPLLLIIARLTAAVAVAGWVHEMVLEMQGMLVLLSKEFFSGRGKRGVGKISWDWGKKAFVLA